MVIEATRKVVAKETIIAKVLCSNDLMLEKFRARRMGTLFRQMVYLCIDHEADAEHNTRHCCPNDSFPEWKVKVWPYVQDENVSYSSQDVYYHSGRRECFIRDDIVVG